MKTRSKKAALGYSLIEIVVVIVVAAIILPAIILPFTEGVRELRLPVIRGTMTLLAQEEMEKKVIWAPYSDVAAWTSTPISGFPEYFSTGDVIYVQQGAFNTQTTGNSGYKRVTVTIASGAYTTILSTVKTNWAETT